MIRKALVKKMLADLLKKTGAEEPMVLSCIVETFLINANSGVSIFSLDGHALLPNLNGATIETERYSFIVDNELPILIYNHIMVSDFPKLEEVSVELAGLELKLKQSINNPWVDLLLNHFYKATPVTAGVLKGMNRTKVEKCEAARAVFELACSQHLKRIQQIYRNSKSKRAIKKWLSKEVKEVMS